MINAYRREFLAGIASAGAVSLSGCACVTAPSIQYSAAGIAALSGPMPLAPPRINTSLRLTREAIDPHCHLFNASDLQVGGYLAGPIANNLPQSLRWIIEGLAPIVEAIVQSIAISAYEEMQQLEDLRQAASVRGLAATETLVTRQIADHKQTVAAELADRIRGTEFEQRLNAHLSASGNVAGLSPGFSENYLVQVFARDANPLDASASLLGALDRTGSIFAFVGHMLSPRFHNLRNYQNAFTAGSQSIGITGCVASLVDFDYWLGRCDHPPSRLEDQVKLHQYMAQLSGGYMKPVVAYNPWTDIKENDEALRIVVDAVTNRGFVGVKIYPPMGYFPYGNEARFNLGEYPTDAQFPDLKLLDKKLQALFETCASLDVPVMAHSNESMGRLLSHDMLGGPSGWREFFADSRNAGARISLGHMGGEQGGAGNAANWTREFVELMAEPGASRLYGDLGFWDRLVAGDAAALARLRQLLDTPVSNGEFAHDRLMFATDWYMLSTEPDWNQYAVRFQRALKDSGVSDAVLEKLFATNARRLFRL